MPTYYWENPVGAGIDCGKFDAKDDKDALCKLPKTAVVMYKESDTKSGLPFLIVYEKNR